MIILINSICVFAACCPEIFNKLFKTKVMSQSKPMTQTEKVESSIISTGISVLTLVIAVWTGLSIANTIDDKKRVDDLEKKNNELN